MQSNMSVLHDSSGMRFMPVFLLYFLSQGDKAGNDVEAIGCQQREVAS